MTEAALNKPAVELKPVELKVKAKPKLVVKPVKPTPKTQSVKAKNTPAVTKAAPKKAVAKKLVAKKATPKKAVPQKVARKSIPNSLRVNPRKCIWVKTVDHVKLKSIASKLKVPLKDLADQAAAHLIALYTPKRKAKK